MNKRIFAAAICLSTAPLHAAGLAAKAARVQVIPRAAGTFLGKTGGSFRSDSFSPALGMKPGGLQALRVGPSVSRQDSAPGMEGASPSGIYPPAPGLSPTVEASMTPRRSAPGTLVPMEETMVLLENDPAVSTILKEGVSGDLPATSAALGRLADGSRFLPGGEAEIPAAPALSETQPYLRPASERWTVGHKTYDSTGELLKAAERGEIKSGATALHESRALATAAPTWRDRIKDAAGDALGIGTIGAFLGAVTGAILAVVTSLSELMTLALYGHPTPMGPEIVLIPVGMGWLFAAAVGAVASWRDSKKFEGFTNSRSGGVENFRGNWVFRPKGDQAPVDLARHRDAPAFRAPHAAQLTRWFDPFLGVAFAAAMGAAAFFVPIGPVLLGSGIASYLWTQKDAGLAGAFLGGVYGYAAAGLFYALGLAAGVWPAVFAAAWAALAAGIWVVPLIRRDLRISKDLAAAAPWWNR